MRTELVILGFILLLIGAIADVVSTVYAVQLFGHQVESNPIMRLVFKNHGTDIVVVMKFAVVAIIGWTYLHYRGTDEWFDKWYPRILYAGGLFWIALGINNFYIMHECGMIMLNILTIVI